MTRTRQRQPGSLRDKLEIGHFVVTSELNPPKGVDLEPMLATAAGLAGCVDAFNVTDGHGARMALAPMAAAHRLIDHGIEPILQMTTRDSNRIGLQARLLGAAALGVSNVVFMRGDPPEVGDHPEVKAVFDLQSVELLEVASMLQRGTDMMGNRLQGSPSFLLGAVCNPGAADLQLEIEKLHAKIAAGARFIQTQAVYDPAAFERFAVRAHGCGAALLAGIIPIRSAKQAHYLNDRIPGIRVPEAIIREIADAEDPVQAGVEIAARTIAAIRPLCQGVHVMALGLEARIPSIMEAAGLPC
jgi:methylenetetrahydrofolate reductase (NADH)